MAIAEPTCAECAETSIGYKHVVVERLGTSGSPLVGRGRVRRDGDLMLQAEEPNPWFFQWRAAAPWGEAG
ncbi:MAG: hypothetical protein OXC26_15525 [Albidovulum sp.]|nr:hypothetical protein [Albidovulum sp.]